MYPSGHRRRFAVMCSLLPGTSPRGRCTSFSFEERFQDAKLILYGIQHCNKGIITLIYNSILCYQDQL